MSAAFKLDLHQVDNYQRDGRIITTTVGRRTTRYVLPSGARISLARNETSQRATLEIGGYKSLTCMVLGPLDEMEGIFDDLT